MPGRNYNPIPEDPELRLSGTQAAGPVNMGGFWGDIRNFFPRMFGQQDIELENESGMIDPRIPAPLDALRKAFNTTNKYAAGRDQGTSAIDALRAAGRR